MAENNQLVDDVSRIVAAYERVLPEMDALPAAELLPINIDVPSAVTTALGAWPEISALRDELAKLQGFDIAQLDKLLSYARATSRAHALYMAASSPAGLSELGEQVAKLREVFHLDAVALAGRGVLDGQRLKELKGPPGYKNMAFDVLMLVEMFREKWSVLEGKTLIHTNDLTQAQDLADRLMEAVGLREQAPVQAMAAADRRQRAFTLFMNAYDQARRAVTYLRWAEGDVDSIAPSLYAGRGGSKRRQPVQPQPPAVPSVSGAGAAQAPIPGLPGGAPFTAS